MIVFHDNHYVDAKSASLNTSNRSFRYGDGLFESMRLINGKITFWKHHYSRLILGMDCLKMNIPETWQPKFLEEIILQLAKKNETENAKIRLMVYRQGDGLYAPNSNEAGIFAECSPNTKKFYQLNKQGLGLGLFEDVKKPLLKISAFKTNNSLPYILACNFCSENNFDDCLILNTEDRLAEASSSNVFLVKNGSLETPAANEGGINGVMRMVLIKLVKQLGITLTETTIDVARLTSADEVFLTNAAKGIQWVATFDGKIYQNKLSAMLLAKLNEKVAKEMAT